MGGGGTQPSRLEKKIFSYNLAIDFFFKIDFATVLGNLLKGCQYFSFLKCYDL